MHVIDAQHVFCCTLYLSFSGEMGPDFGSKMTVKSLTSQQLVRIHQLLRQAKFDDPSGHVSNGVCIMGPFHLYFIFFIFFSF